MTALEDCLVKQDIDVLYVFPKNAPFTNWGEHGKYTKNHVVYTADFSPYKLATTVQTLVKSEKLIGHIIIHMHFLDWKAIGAITCALRKENCMFIVQEHMRADFGREQLNLTWMRRRKEFVKQILYKHATVNCRMIGVSDAVYQDLCIIRGDYERTFMVRNAIVTSRLIGVCTNVLQLDNTRDVVIFGTHFERKGVDIALQAVIKAGTGLRLVILTHNEKETKEKLDTIYSEWQRFAVVAHVVENIQCVYNYALCFVSPSRSEAFGYAVAEAAYCDTQVIASDIPGQNSMKCVPGIQWICAEQVDDLTIALLKCYELHRDYIEKIERMKMIQREYIDKHFGIEKWCREIMKVYKLEETNRQIEENWMK